MRPNFTMIFSVFWFESLTSSFRAWRSIYWAIGCSDSSSSSISPPPPLSITNYWKTKNKLYWENWSLKSCNMRGTGQHTSCVLEMTLIPRISLSPPPPPPFSTHFPLLPSMILWESVNQVVPIVLSQYNPLVLDFCSCCVLAFSSRMAWWEEDRLSSDPFSPLTIFKDPLRGMDATRCEERRG